MLFSNSKQKDAAKALQKAMTEGKEQDIQQAWENFHDSVAKTVEERYLFNSEHNAPKQKSNAPFMRFKDYDNNFQFRQAFLSDKDKSSYMADEEKMTIGDFGKGILLNQWGDYKQQANKVDGSVITPVHILSDIIYSAMDHSVLLGNCPVLGMEEGRVLIGKVKDDLEMDFKAPYAEGKETTLGLEGISLEAKTLYAYVEISEEDLQDMKNLDSILRRAFGMAVAKALDSNFLYTNTNAQEEDEEELNYFNANRVYPKGILDKSNIKKITVSKTDYDMIAKANLEISKANGKPNTIGFNPVVNYKLQTIKDGTGQYINTPHFYSRLNAIESNGLKENDVIVFDSNQILIGIRKSMDIKLLPDLKKGTVVMRCMLRADVATTREDHICLVNIEESTKMLDEL